MIFSVRPILKDNFFGIICLFSLGFWKRNRSWRTTIVWPGCSNMINKNKSTWGFCSGFLLHPFFGYLMFEPFQSSGGCVRKRTFLFFLVFSGCKQPLMQNLHLLLVFFQKVLSWEHLGVTRQPLWSAGNRWLFGLRAYLLSQWVWWYLTPCSQKQLPRHRAPWTEGGCLIFCLPASWLLGGSP